MGQKDPIHVKTLERDGVIGLAILEAEFDCHNRMIASLKTTKYETEITSAITAEIETEIEIDDI